MLHSLYIKNFAIIQEITIEFNRGLNILTGETGAGKSIIINAVDLLMGSRFSKSMIRTGEDRCVIEGVFKSKLRSHTIRRVFSKSGNSKTYINDEPATLDELKSRSEFLVDMHGQHEHQRLLNSDFHLEYLDAFGDYETDLLTLMNTFKSIMDVNNKYNEIKRIEKDYREKRELYEFQLNELKVLKLYTGIDEKVDSEYRKLINTQEIIDTLKTLSEYLDGSQNAVAGEMNKHIRELKNHGGLDDDLDSLIHRVNSTQVELQDLAQELTHYSSQMTVDADQISMIGEKLEHIEMLKRKYGGSIDGVISYQEEIEKYLQGAHNQVSDLKELEEKLTKLKDNYFSLSSKLTITRLKTADELEKKIISTLNQLDMSNTKIKISLHTNSEEIGTGKGQDNCEILISPNMGEELRPLHKIASGGELSRFMLAIKFALQEKDPVDTIIFDEVDSGISGKTAEKAGNLIEQLGDSRQVICITHLSQIASKGCNHLNVYKVTDGSRTKVAVKQLSKDERIQEIAGLISGRVITKSGKLQAEELLEGYHG